VSLRDLRASRKLAEMIANAEANGVVSNVQRMKRELAYSALNALRAPVKPVIGAGDHTDPVWVLLNTSLDEIEMMLDLLIRSLDAPVSKAITAHVKQQHRGDGMLFSSWDREFVLAINDVYDRRTLAGYHDRPLSGKQLVILHGIYRKLALDVAYSLEIGEIK